MHRATTPIPLLLCAALFAVLAALAGDATAAPIEKLSDLGASEYAADYVGQEITLRGVVRPPEVSLVPGATIYYRLRDDTADNIRVRSKGNPPAVGALVEITGTWYRGPDDDEGNPTYFLHEEVRELITGGGASPDASEGDAESAPGSGDSSAANANPAGSESDGSTPPAASKSGSGQDAGELEEGSSLWIIVIAILLGFIVLVAVVWFLLIRRGQKVEEDVDPNSRTSRVDVGGTVDIERTMKVENDKVAFHVPETEMTMGVVPGKLTVVQGDDLGEIRLYRTGGEAAWTFGREPGQPLRHFQIKDPTVSRQHATLRFSDKAFHLTNHSHTNPVIVNGAEVPVDGSVDLEDQSVIMLGDVTLKFFEVKVG